jgi:hypothetical protein
VPLETNPDPRNPYNRGLRGNKVEDFQALQMCVQNPRLLWRNWERSRGFQRDEKRGKQRRWWDRNNRIVQAALRGETEGSKIHGKQGSK